MTSLKNGISVVINTKNEEHNIKDCIDSVRDIADEIIVVDMQSQDKTREIAKKLGAKIFKVKDFGYVEPARNIALKKPAYDWTLVVDADERLPKKLKSKIQELTKENKYDGFKIPFKNMFFGTWINHSVWWPDYHIRLFKTGHLDWPKGVHQDQIFKGTLFELEPIENNAFVHNNIADIKEMLEMVDHYSGVEAIFKSKKNLKPKDMIEYLDKEFKWRYFEHNGYLDGMHGFFLAKFMNIYRFLEVVKLWERQGYQQWFTPADLKIAAEEGYSNSTVNKEDYDKLKADMEKIQSAKFYKLWQSFNTLKKMILRK